MGGQPVCINLFRRRRRGQHRVIISKARDGEFRSRRAAGGQAMHQTNPPFGGRRIGANCFKKSRRVFARDLKTAEHRKISKPRGIGHGLNLLGDRIKPVVALKTIRGQIRTEVNILSIKPIRSFPTMGKPHHRTPRQHAFVQRGKPKIAPLRAFFIRIVNPELQPKTFNGFRHTIITIRPASKAAAIDGQSIHRRGAMGHPMR